MQRNTQKVEIKKKKMIYLLDTESDRERDGEKWRKKKQRKGGRREKERLRVKTLLFFVV